MGSGLIPPDGGGTRSISTILIIRALMAEIAVQKQTILSEASSSASPLPLESQTVQRRIRRQSSQESQSEPPQYLPCHYFDYNIGTSFGGYVHLTTVYYFTVSYHKLVRLVSLLLC